MLTMVKLRNFVTMEEVEVELGAGLTVVTGETGAGKSLVIDAVGLLVGARADPLVIRAGAAEAAVEAELTRTPVLVERLGELGLEDGGDAVIIRRTVGRNGKGRVHVNGSPTTVSVLSRLMRGLVDVSGQHEHLRLLDAGEHLGLLDAFGRHGDALGSYRRAHARLRELERELERLGGDQRQADRELAELEFLSSELDAVAPGKGEEETLDAERRRLSSAGRLELLAHSISELLDGEEESAAQRLRKAAHGLGDARRLDPGLAALEGELREAQEAVDEVARALRRYVAQLESSPHRLQEVEDRLDTLRRLSRKHGVPCDGLPDVVAALASKVAELKGRTARREVLCAEVEKARALVTGEAAELSERRQLAARTLASEVNGLLGALGLKGATFAIGVDRVEPGPTGADVVRLDFTGNPGEEARPLGRVASGGELSRLMLALKCALKDSDSAVCSVFDEVDAGLGGAASDVVGRLIKDLARRRQVLLVTHAPQVAAHADVHLRVHKRHLGERTSSEVERLDEAQRQRELARMLSGLTVTREARDAAEALLRRARRGRSLKAVEVLLA